MRYLLFLLIFSSMIAHADDSQMTFKEGNTTINIRQLIIIDNGNHYITVEKDGIEHYYITKGENQDSFTINNHRTIELGN